MRAVISVGLVSAMSGVIGCGNTSGTDKSNVASLNSGFDTLCWQVKKIAEVKSRTESNGFFGSDKKTGKLVPMTPADYFGSTTVQCDTAKKVVVETHFSKDVDGKAVERISSWQIGSDGVPEVFKETKNGVNLNKNEKYKFQGDGVNAFGWKGLNSKQNIPQVPPTPLSGTRYFAIIESGTLQCIGKSSDDLKRDKSNLTEVEVVGSASVEFNLNSSGNYKVVAKVDAAVTFIGESGTIIAKCGTSSVAAENR